MEKPNLCEGIDQMSSFLLKGLLRKKKKERFSGRIYSSVFFVPLPFTYIHYSNNRQ